MPSQASPADVVKIVRSVLQHEQRIGHTDRASIGGLARFWEHWAPQLATAYPIEVAGPVLAKVSRLLADYASASPDARAERVALCLEHLGGLGEPRPRAASGPFRLTSAARERPTGNAPARPEPRRELTAPVGNRSPENPSVPPAPTAPAAARSSAAARKVADGRPKAATQPAVKVARPAAQSPESKPAPRVRRAPNAVGDLDAPVTGLSGVGPANGEKLAKLGISTVRDLLYHFPTRHIDYRDVRAIRDLRDLGEGAYQTILATVVNVKVDHLRQKAAPAGQWLFADPPQPKAGRGGLLRICATLRDETGSIEAVWIRAQDYLSREFRPGRQVIVSGECRARWRADVYEFADPDYEFVGGAESIHTGRLVPVYRLTQSLGARWLRKLIKSAVDSYAHQLVDHLPSRVREAASLLDLPSAIAQIHFPDSPELLERAHRRLAFDEFFLIQYRLLERRQEWQSGPPAIPLADGEPALRRFVASLPYTLTGAQARVIDEIVGDVSTTRSMSRLLEGEVGSGKTVVAAGAALVAVASGCQAAIMAPTEILAEQHHRTIGKLLGQDGLLGEGDASRPVKLALLTGSLRRADKLRLRREIARGEVDVVVGTHALIQEDVEFSRLGLAIVDEQHRFGVAQRTALREKGQGAHLLVMTATPIPRTLALTVYGDLDLSVIDELPPGRQEIRTKCFGPDDRAVVYEALRQEVQSGHQGYVICPLVEESERLEAKAAIAEYERLQHEIFSDLRLGLLHGRMKPAEKDEAMRAFQRGEVDVLVATAVVEVGVDVPNATCMIIEGADRFGLAQLHQFRGRIGRGSARSYCALVSESSAEAARERLEVVARTRDGFRLAEEDLRLRGPGEFFGTRQSGLPDLKLARPGDEALLEQARGLAGEVFHNPEAAAPSERQLLQNRIEQLWRAAEQN